MHVDAIITSIEEDLRNREVNAAKEQDAMLPSTPSRTVGHSRKVSPIPTEYEVKLSRARSRS